MQQKDAEAPFFLFLFVFLQHSPRNDYKEILPFFMFVLDTKVSHGNKLTRERGESNLQA